MEKNIVETKYYKLRLAQENELKAKHTIIPMKHEEYEEDFIKAMEAEVQKYKPDCKFETMEDLNSCLAITDYGFYVFRDEYPKYFLTICKQAKVLREFLSDDENLIQAIWVEMIRNDYSKGNEYFEYHGLKATLHSLDMTREDLENDPRVEKAWDEAERRYEEYVDGE